MLTIMQELPDNILGIRAAGKVTAANYENQLIPALEAKLKHHKKVRVLYEIADDFEGYEMGAMLDDAKVGMKYMAAWERVAFVSDHAWINSLAGFFRHLIPVELRTYKLAEADAALTWLQTESHHQSWLEHALERINTEFPLSGGETNADLEDGADGDDDTTEREHLNTNFPLSGGAA